MADTRNVPQPDFTQGFALQELPDGGQVLGRVGKEKAILVRQGDRLFAVGASCTHYHGPLVEGLVVGDTVRCPWHHACFSLRTGEALRAPALDSIPCWRVERVGDKAYVREKLTMHAASASPASVTRAPASVVIVGGGGAGLAAADMLRRRGYDGPLTMLSADARRRQPRRCRRVPCRRGRGRRPHAAPGARWRGGALGCGARAGRRVAVAVRVVPAGDPGRHS